MEKGKEKYAVYFAFHRVSCQTVVAKQHPQSGLTLIADMQCDSVWGEIL